MPGDVTTLAAPSVESRPPTTAPVRASRRRRWTRRLASAGVLVLLLVVFHEPLLTFVGGLLVVDEPLAPADAVVIMGASGPYRAVPIDAAADLYAKGMAARILLIEDRSSRLVKTGVLPTLEAIIRREAGSRRVPREVVTVLWHQDGTEWNSMRLLGHCLEKNAPAQVTVLCGEFDSRTYSQMAQTVLAPELVERIRWHALPDRRYTAGDWWHTRQGILAVLGSYVFLAHTYVMGEPDAVRRWDPDQYERDLVDRSSK